MNKYITALLIIACLMVVALDAQVYTLPKLSPRDVANWANGGGFVASSTAEPTITAGIAAGSLYVDTTVPLYPKLYRFNGTAWAPLSGDSEALIEHLAKTIDPHGAIMKVSEAINVGDPALAPWANIDSPVAGQVRISSYTVHLGLTTAPTATAGAIYFNSATGHFMGCMDGTNWVQLDN
jgi:hypothetical protein